MKTMMQVVGLGMMVLMGLGQGVWGQDAQGTCSNTGAPVGADQNGPQNTKIGGDPIDFATGALIYTRTDLTLPGPRPLSFTRTFTGRDYGVLTVMGGGFVDNCHKTVTLGTSGMGYQRGDGTSIPLMYVSGSVAGRDLVAKTKQYPYYTMTMDADENMTITDVSGNREIFQLNSGYGVIVKSVDRNGNEFDYTYSGIMGISQLMSVSDPESGRSFTFEYDDNGNLTSVTDSTGRRVTYDYESETDGGDLSFLSHVTYPDSTVIQYLHEDEFQDLTGIKDQNGNTSVETVYSGYLDNVAQIARQTYDGGISYLAYDVVDKKITYTDARGTVTDYYSDGNRNITKVVVHAPSTPLHGNETGTTTFTTTYAYGTGTATIGGFASDGPVPDSSTPNNCYKTKEVDPNGNSISWTYDSNGNKLTETKSPTTSTTGTAAFTTTWTYTTTGSGTVTETQVASVTDANGHKTTYDYGDSSTNPTGNLLKITYPTTAAGTAQETFTYNSKGQVLTDTAPDGTVTKNCYDGTTGFLTKTIKDYGSGKLNATTTYTYDEYGHVATVQDANGHTTTMTTNAMDEVTEIDGASGEVEQFTYDNAGNVLTDEKQAPGSGWQKTVNIYNSYQQLTETHRYTDSSTYLTTSYTYDANGNRITVTDPLGHTTTTAYDERDKPYQITDPLSHTVTYDFDGNGNTIKLTDELSHVTTYEYDGYNRLKKKTYPDSSYQKWCYDKVGNITSLRTTAGNTITQTYDTRNRMLAQVYPVSSGTSTITNTYDIMGRLLTATEGGTSLTYVYDDLGRNTSFTDQAGRTSTYTYDLVGNRLPSTYPTSTEVKLAYDSSNRLTTIKDGSDTTQATYSYDTLDRATGITLANSTSVSYGYDLLSRVTSVDNTLGGSTTRNYSYVYDDANRVTSTTEPRGTIASGYTDRDEVNSITEPSGSPFADQSFDYDAGFNRSSWTLGSTTTSYTANNLNQYTAISGTTAPTWNTDGGLASYGGNTYTYDSMQRVTEIDYSGGKALFSYDPLGRRVQKVDENGSGAVLSTVSYHYDGSQVAVEYQPSSVTWTYFGIAMRTDGTHKQWYYRDGHGSTVAVTDSSGNMIEQYEYNMQGQVQVADGSGTVLMASAIANDIMYAGYRYDNETGNYFCNARYYNPVLGRFFPSCPFPDWPGSGTSYADCIFVVQKGFTGGEKSGEIVWGGPWACRWTSIYRDPDP